VDLDPLLGLTFDGGSSRLPSSFPGFGFLHTLIFGQVLFSTFDARVLTFLACFTFRIYDFTKHNRILSCVSCTSNERIGMVFRRLISIFDWHLSIRGLYGNCNYNRACGIQSHLSMLLVMDGNAGGCTMGCNKHALRVFIVIQKIHSITASYIKTKMVCKGIISSTAANWRPGD
jgi:hypothetical protein